MPSKPPPPSPAAPDLAILAGDAMHLRAAGYTELPHAPLPERNLVEQMARFRTAPLDFLREISLHVSGTGWRSYENVVGQPIFYAGFSERMKGLVLQSPMLVAKIEELAGGRVEVESKEGVLGQAGDGEVERERRRGEIRESVMEVAEKLVDEMICKMESRRFIRGAYYLTTQLLTRAYHQGE